jgi:hypothetical protein
MHSELGMGENVVFCNGYNAAIPFQISWHSPNMLHTIVQSVFGVHEPDALYMFHGQAVSL